MVGKIEDAAQDAAGDRAQAAYYRQELSEIRSRAETDLAGHYIELQQVQHSGLNERAVPIRRTIRSLEREIATLEVLGLGLRRWL